MDDDKTQKIIQLFTFVTAEEPWCNDTKLYQPYEAEQILLAENASCLAVKAYLNVIINFNSLLSSNTHTHIERI